MATVIAFSIGKPFRKPVYTNIYFTLNAVTLVLFNYYSILMPSELVIKLLNVFASPKCSSITQNTT